jgi:hypothetical protein
MVIATLVLACPLLAVSGVPFDVPVSVDTTAALGAYWFALPLPDTVDVVAVTEAPPFNAVWFVDDTHTLRAAGWQVTDTPTGSVPILTLTLSVPKGAVALVPDAATFFDTDITELTPDPGVGCDITSRPVTSLGTRRRLGG